MSKFLRPNKGSLKNSQHFEFIQAFITEMDDENWSATKILMLLQLLKTNFSVEDRWYMVARASEIIAQRNEADRRRDDKYSRLLALLRVWAGSGDEVFDAPATALLKPFNLYKVKVNAQLEEQSGQMDNLISDLENTEMQARITALHATYLYNQMKVAHEEVKTLRREQGVEVSEKEIGALVNARRECDKTYDELTYLIEAFEKTADDPAPYEAFIKKWNGTLKIYQDMLDRKSNASGGSGSQQGGSSTEQGGSSTEQGGTSTEQGGTSTEQGGTSSEGGGSTDNGGDTPPGEEGGDNGSGGGDNGGGTSGEEVSGPPPEGGGFGG